MLSFSNYRVTGTGNPWAGQVIDTEAELAVGLTTFMSAFVNFGFALDTGSDQKIHIRTDVRRFVATLGLGSNPFRSTTLSPSSSID